MTIEYRLLDRGAQALVETSELPVEGGISIAVRTTGYEIGKDEIVQLSIVDFEGTELFCQTVKPQNITEWDDAAASGGLMPEDVEDKPELYQFEDEIIELLKNASIVVGQHVDFIMETLESSWISVPDVKSLDLIKRFCATHCAVDYPGEPATVATLDGIAAYYGDSSSHDGQSLTEIAHLVASCYIQLVREHTSERASKDDAYWEDYRRKQEEIEKDEARVENAKRVQDFRTARINAVLWLGSTVIFANIAVQLYIREYDLSYVVVATIATVFFASRWIKCMLDAFRLGKSK